MDQDERPPRKKGEQTPVDPFGQAVSEATTSVDARPPLDGTEEDTLQANQYLGRGVAVLAGPWKPLALCADLTPSSKDCLAPGLLAPEDDTMDEHRSQLGDGVPPTNLPDVRRALEALRAGKSVKPPGTLPYGTGAGGSESKRAVSERGTPSAISVSTGRSNAPAPSGTASATTTEKEVKRAPTRPKVWPSRVAIGVLAVGGWVAAWAVAVSYVRKSNGGPVSPESGLSAASVRTAAPALSAPRDRTESMAEPMVLQKIAEVPVAELTPEQWVMLARERSRVRREELKELARSMEKDSGDQPSRDTMAKLREAASDPRSAPEALLAMTALHGTVGADLIYEVANDDHLSLETRRLALDLLGTKAVQAHVSEALRVVLCRATRKSAERGTRSQRYCWRERSTGRRARTRDS